MNGFQFFPFRRSGALFLVACMVVLTGLFLGTAVFAETIYMVDTVSDDISLEGSLRYAIDQAASGDVITFDLAPYPKTIVLGSQLVISRSINIQGPGAENLAISGNEASRVFYLEDVVGSVDISGISIVSGDAGGNYGGGIYNLSDSLTVDSCNFIGNLAVRGGGIYNGSNSGAAAITNCTFSENSSWGGGICNLSDSLTVDSCNFIGNTGSGGGIYNDDNGSAAITNCTFSGSKLGSIGGGIDNRGNATVTNCTFSGNEAGYFGGGICNLGGNATVINCTFSGNFASRDGGGIYSSGNTSVMNCTFSGNEAASAGGIYNDRGNATVTNSIFWNNTYLEIYNNGNTTLSYCVVQSGDCGSGSVISGDPLLEPLANNGGVTWTCAIEKGSSAIDTGITLPDVTTDQRGVIRPQGNGYDIGAYEYGPSHHLITTEHNEGGHILPESADIIEGGSADFQMFPDKFYCVCDVYVDGSPVSYDEEALSYTFQDVSDDHVLSADFQPIGCNVSPMAPIGLLLALPLFFLLGKMR